MNILRNKFQQIGSISEGLRNAVSLKSNRTTTDLTELNEVVAKNSDPISSQYNYDIELSECRCRKVEDIFSYTENSDIKSKLADSNKILILKIQITESFNELTATELEELTKIFKEKSIVITLTSRSEFKYFIYWKSYEIQQFLTLKHYNAKFIWEDREAYNFIADFLGQSLRNRELGFPTECLFDEKIEIQKLADSRNYNLLLLAAESGNADVVEILLNLPNMEREIEGVNIQTLAWQGKHSDVLIVLAQADLQYPEGIDISQLSDKFKQFYKRIEEFHTAVRNGNEYKVKEFIFNNSNNLKYFFTTSNASVASVALETKSFPIYELLIANDIQLAAHEKNVPKRLLKQDRRLVRDIHIKYSKNLKDTHINILMAHSYVGHNVQNEEEKLGYVRNAYKFLSSDERIDLILQVVATSRKLKIIFDFNSDSVDTVDPTTSEYTEGIFYPTGKIFVGAKQLLNDNTKHKTLSTMAHEGSFRYTIRQSDDVFDILKVVLLLERNIISKST